MAPTQPTPAEIAAEAATKAALWALAAALLNIRAAVPVTLKLSTSNFLQWRGMFSDVVEKYALEDHLDEKENPTDPTPQWSRNDAIVRSWLNSTVAPELLAMASTPPRYFPRTPYGRISPTSTTTMPRPAPPTSSKSSTVSNRGP